jgi:SpoVK/Ycf46/Vps4 family AAA+-type ATPase
VLQRLQHQWQWRSLLWHSIPQQDRKQHRFLQQLLSYLKVTQQNTLQSLIENMVKTLQNVFLELDNGKYFRSV